MCFCLLLVTCTCCKMFLKKIGNLYLGFMLWSNLDIVMVSGVAMVRKNMDIEPRSTLLSTKGKKKPNCLGFGSILHQFGIWEIFGAIFYT